MHATRRVTFRDTDVDWPSGISTEHRLPWFISILFSGRNRQHTCTPHAATTLSCSGTAHAWCSVRLTDADGTSESTEDSAERAHPLSHKHTRHSPEWSCGRPLAPPRPARQHQRGSAVVRRRWRHDTGGSKTAGNATARQRQRPHRARQARRHRHDTVNNSQQDTKKVQTRAQGDGRGRDTAPPHAAERRRALARQVPSTASHHAAPIALTYIDNRSWRQTTRQAPTLSPFSPRGSWEVGVAIESPQRSYTAGPERRQGR